MAEHAPTFFLAQINTHRRKSAKSSGMEIA
jgi:hypothetical protein